MRFERGLDRAVTGGVAGIIALSPWAFGGAHRAAFTTLEAASFALFAGCMIKRARGAPAMLAIPRGIGMAVLPAAALLLLVAFELTPLPPRVMRAIAPASYQLNRLSFPGWPVVSPSREAAIMEARPSDRAVSSGAGATAASDAQTRPAGLSGWRWRTLAIAPEATASGLIEWLALGAIVATVALYPFGLIGERETARDFYRIVCTTILLTGTVVAAEGLLQRAWWNGKLLWIWTAWDWGGPLLGSAPRANGPFVDADHFANFLGMILPLAAVAAWFPLKIVEPPDKRANLRVAALLGSLLIGFGLMFSMSRGGWIAAIAGVGVALALAGGARDESGTWKLRRRYRSERLLVVAVALVLVIASMVWVAGSGGRDAVASRLSGDQNSLYYRPTVWRNTLRMIRDFPLFGVGLGGWPDLFPHYRRPPWSPFFFRQAENDYLQWAAELGVFGVALMAWLMVRLAVGLSRDWREMPGRYRTLLAGLLGGVATALVHEGVDFSLRTPANAWLFVILIALSLRIAAERSGERSAREMRRALPVRKQTRRWAAGWACAGCAMIVAVYLQDGSAYPYASANPSQIDSIMSKLMSHPAMAESHLMLAEALATRGNDQLRDAEMKAALWLDPNDPGTRDRYARELLASGNKRAGLDEIARSVERSPDFKTHYYLGAGVIPWLLPEEQTAIAAGLEKAVDRQYSGAVETLADFYGELGRYDDRGKLFAKLAAGDTNPADKITELIEAGKDYALAGEETIAIEELRAASAIAPQDARPYAELARAVYGPNHQIDEAQRVIQEGQRAGADTAQLEIALAAANEEIGNHCGSEAALETALRVRPTFAIAMRLGRLYLNDGRAGRAAAAFARATAINPELAEAWFALGEARERDYEYAAAGRAYERAQALAPDNRYYASVREEFARRMARPVEDVKAQQ